MVKGKSFVSGGLAGYSALFDLLMFSLVVFGLGFSVDNALAEGEATTSANASVTVSSACTMVGTMNTAHTASLDNGAFRENIGETVLTANCNDNDGIAIYAVGFTGETIGVNYLRDNSLFNTYGNTYDIQTGVGQSGDSKWAMKLTAVSNGTDTPSIATGYDDYHTVPSEYTLVASKNSGTTTSGGASIKATYSAYVSGTQPAGVYEGKVKYVMVHPATHPAPFVPHAETTASGRICYYPNTDEHEGTMGCQTIPDSGETDGVSPTSATLLASNFSRDGYGFAGWTNKYDYATNPTQEGIKFYGPNETITFTAGQYSGSNNGLSLYAVWIKSAGSLRDQSKVAQLCGTNGTGGSLTIAPTDGTANLASVSALTDERDHQTYAIAKLADGKCWMIENLRLESTAEHNTDGTLAQGYHSSFIGLADAESEHFSDSDTTANSLYTTEADAANKNTISGNYQAYRFPRYNNLNTKSRAQNSPSSNTFSNNNTDGGMYSYGNYYTWHAAIADTTHNGSNNTSSDTTSICPKGWRLPRGGQSTVTSGQNGDFYVLTTTISGTTPNNVNGGSAYYSGTVEGVDVGKLASDSLRGYPNNFLYSGLFYSSSAYYRGSYGVYWSSTARTNGNSYHLSLDSSNVVPGTDYSIKYDGFSIRCVSGS